jgi:hypothetical protein
MNRLSAPWITLLATTSIALLAIPFVWSTTIGAIDYPNHLARYYILTHIDQSPYLSRYYAVHWTLLPNLGLDALIFLLHNLTGFNTDTISHYLMMFVLCSTPICVSFLHYSYFRVISFWPFMSVLFSFNYVLLYGFMNYILALNLAIACSAVWIINGNTLKKAIIFNIITSVICLVHLFGIGIYAILVAGHEVREILANRDFSARGFLRRLPATLQFVAPAFIFLTSSTSGAAHRIKLSGLYHKAIALYSVVDLGEPTVSLATGAFLAVIIIGLFLRRQMTFNEAGTISLLMMAVVFVFMPFTLFGSGFADYRLPLAMALSFFALTQPTGVSVRGGAVIMIGAATFALWRSLFLMGEWQMASARYAELKGAFIEHIPRGARIFAVLAEEDSTMRFARRPPVGHFSLLAVNSNDAFVPSIFAEPGKQIVSVRPIFQPLLHPGPGMPLYGDPDPLVWSNVVNYDYVVLYARSPLRRAVPTHLRPVEGPLPRDLFIFSVVR